MAGDAEDLSVLSAMLQDAIAEDWRFCLSFRLSAVLLLSVIVLSGSARCRGSAGPFARVRAGMHFDDVVAAKFQHLRSEAKDAVVELLAVRFEPGEDGGGVIMLDFAGGGAVRLEVESVNAYLADMSEPWRTRAKPAHKE